MSFGYGEYASLRVKITRAVGEPLIFALPQTEPGVAFTGRTAPVLEARVSRMIGQPGSAAISIPARPDGETGAFWSEIISLQDTVEVEAFVQRFPGPQDNSAGLSHEWRNVFLGFVLNVDDDDLIEQEGGMVTVTTIVADDAMGILSQNHFTYWRSLGEVFKGSGIDEGIIEKLKSLEKSGFHQDDLVANSIAASADIIFQSFIYSRLLFRRKISGQSLLFDEMHGYHFESDDRGINVSLTQLAPESSTWLEAVTAAVDAEGGFYEFYLDNLPVKDAGATLATGTGAGRTNKAQVRDRAAKAKLRGDTQETFVIRPSPFPTYNPDTGVNMEAWDSLPLQRALPATAPVKRRLNRALVYSVFSVDIPTLGVNNSVADDANTNAQLVADVHKLAYVVGYKALDVQTKRLPIAATNVQPNDDAYGGRPELARELAWQMLAFYQLNDLFVTGEVRGPLDLRARMGVRFEARDYLYYVDGYTHEWSPERGHATTRRVSRGLPSEMYGVRPMGRVPNPDWQDYVKKYLGRQRPGEQHAPVQGAAITEGYAEEAEEVEP